MISAMFCAGVVLGGGFMNSQVGSSVRILKESGRYELKVDGQPFFIKGVGGNGSLKMLQEAGGNSFRTWGADQLGVDLDNARKHGMKVVAGIWLHHSTYFDYSNAAEVKKQYDEAMEVVKKYKDHPALLMWAFGNEMEGYGAGDNPAIYKAINDIAKGAKAIDGRHPTMTVTAEIGGSRVKFLHEYCPDIDVMGINSYGGAASLGERYRAAGGTKPYIITEFGPLGQWEVGKTKWDAPIEMTSTAKAEIYRTAYQKSVSGNSGQCLGSFAFLWGNKQEATSTWFGMLLKDGSKVEAVDVMTELWSGKAPANRCPKIETLVLDGENEVSGGTVVQVKLKASDPENDSLQVKWVVMGETVEYLSAGQEEKIPPTYPGAVIAGTSTLAKVKLPNKSGGYRIFAYIYDGQGGAAVGNIPIFVKAATSNAGSKVSRSGAASVR